VENRRGTRCALRHKITLRRRGIVTDAEISNDPGERHAAPAPPDSF
jgi:hypothetical protein